MGEISLGGLKENFKDIRTINYEDSSGWKVNHYACVRRSLLKGFHNGRLGSFNLQM